MRPAVVTVALLGVVYYLFTVSAGPFSIRKMCLRRPDNRCSEGWSRIDENRCATYIQSQKTFHEAQEHCRTLNSDLVSLHGYNELYNLLCLTWRADPRPQAIWIGAQRSEGSIRNTDGSEFKLNVWFRVNKYRGKDPCIILKVGDEPWFSAVRCSKEKNFVCAKNM